jgi:hypothetical protein
MAVRFFENARYISGDEGQVAIFRIRFRPSLIIRIHTSIIQQRFPFMEIVIDKSRPLVLRIRRVEGDPNCRRNEGPNHKL